MSTFNDTGISMDNFSDIKSQMVSELKSALGDNIQTDPESDLGNMIDIFASAIADQNDFIEAIVSAFNPQSAAGTHLSNMVLINGISRNEARYSTGTLQCTANAAGSTVPAGTLVSDPATGNQFETDSVVVVPPSGTNTVSITAVTAGATEASAGTITQIDTPVYGLASVTNPSDIVVGQSEESDSALRARRFLVSQRSGNSSISAILRTVSEVTNVTSVVVHENNKQEIDKNGVPGNSIWVIVEGGANADIAEAIFGSKSAGINTFGGVGVVHIDTDTGTSATINFTRPTTKYIYIDLTIVKNSLYPSDGDDQIRQAVIDYFNGDFELNGVAVESVKIGDDVITNKLFAPINSTVGHYVTDLFIGFSAWPVSSANLVLSADELAKTDTSYIRINGVV